MWVAFCVLVCLPHEPESLTFAASSSDNLILDPMVSARLGFVVEGYSCLSIFFLIGLILLISQFSIFFPKSCAASRGFLDDVGGVLLDTYSTRILIRSVGWFESVTSTMQFTSSIIIVSIWEVFKLEIFAVNKSPSNDSFSINAQECVWQLSSMVALLALNAFIIGNFS